MQLHGLCKNHSCDLLLLRCRL